MQISEMQLSARQLARLTGFFYFLIIFCGLYGGLVARGAIVDPADSGGTLQRLIELESLYRLGFMGDLIMVISDVVVSVLFYFLLKHVHVGLAALAAAFRLIQSAVLGANLINLFQPLLMIWGHAQMDAAELASLETDITTQLLVFDYGYLISGMFFAVNCLLMGYLLFKSPLFPKILGILIAVASLGYAFNCLAHFVAPSLIEASQVFMFFTAVLAEVVLCAFLIIKGVRTPASTSSGD